ncbi:hypothetical protein NIES22_24280 [Calothrix brevissima NIES-22]|nr:hypothetical protein NIES22_24280 [Calothrix brevissima NIES-22]
MGEDNNNYNLSQENEVDNFLNVAPIKEDWGGDGSGRINLSGRCTAISQEYVPRQYQFFDTNNVPAIQDWRITGMPDEVVFGSQRLLSWNDFGASTSRINLPPQFKAPSGIFTSDLEIFILKGKIQIGEWQMTKHCYSFIPAGVYLGDWQVLGDEDVEILWMENGNTQYKNYQYNHPDAKLDEFIPVLNSKLSPWNKTETIQFEVAKKKFLRKHKNDGGTWLLAILPHYDGKYPMIQSYNEEAYCLGGYCDIGDFRFVKDCFGYVPSFTIAPWHRTDDGCLFLIRVDRDLSKIATVLSYQPGDT